MDKDLKQIIDVVADGAIAIAENLKDGFQYTDIFALVPVFSQIPEAIKDANNALHYLAEMTKEKEEEIINEVMLKLQNASQKTKDIVTFLLRTLANAYMLYITAAKSDVADTAK